MTRGIAKKNGRPAHEMFEGRTKASVPMEVWMMRHRKEGYGRHGFAVRLSSFGSNRLRRFAAYALQSLSRGER